MLLYCPNSDVSSLLFKVFAATQTTGTHLASTYAIEPNSSAEAPWLIITFGG